MGLAEQLWQDNQAIAIACLEHPFVQGLATGSLPPSVFAYYVGQDAFFLEAFARAYSVAAAKVPDWQGFGVFHELAAGVLEELKLHQGYATTWGVDLSAVQPGPATRRYTDFLLGTAWSQPVGQTAAAMSPCMRLYGFLGQSLAAQGIPDHQYGDWIATYSSDDFTPLVQQLANLLDQYGRAEGEQAAIAAAYRYAMLCERDFFEAAWQTQFSSPDAAE